MGGRRETLNLDAADLEVLNTSAVIQDLEASEEYEYARLFRILLEIERSGDAELCVRNFLTEPPSG